MTTTTIEEIVVKFGADIEDIQKKLQAVENRTKQAATSITKYLAPLAAAFAGKRLFYSFTRQSDALGKLSEQLGENVEDIDAWGQAVQHEGGSVEGFNASITALQKNIGQLAATGEGRAKKFFDNLGIRVRDAQGNVRKTTDILLELSDRAEELDKTEFIGIASRLGLDDKTIKLLQTGRKSVRETLDDLRRRSITKRDAEVAAQYNDSIQDLQKSIQSVANIALRLLVPVFSAITRGVTSFFDLIRENKGITTIFFTTLIGLIGIKLIDALKKLGTAWLANPSTIVITAIIAGIALIILAIQDFYTWVKGGESLLGEWLGPFEDAINSAKEWINDLIDTWNKWLDAADLKSFGESVGYGYEDQRDYYASRGVASAQRAMENRTDIQTVIDKIEVNTAATDAAGIAAGISVELTKNVSKSFALQAGRSNRT